MNEQRAAKTRVRRGGLGTGTTSLLMIFTLLCLATLAMLSLSTAASDRRIKEGGLSAAQELAAAQGESARYIAEIDEVLLAGRERYTPAEYISTVLTNLEEQGYEINLVEKNLQFAVNINDNNVLVTQLKIFPADAAQRYAVHSQVQVSIMEWVPEQGGSIWQGD